MKRILFLLLAVACALPLAAQTLKFSGELRERSEFDTKSSVIRTSSDVFHLLRTRLRADAAVNEQVSVTIEVQDARVYGATQTTFNVGSPAFDLRQGFVEVKKLYDTPLSFKLGRQALLYGNQRLLGPIDWHNQGQTFDGAVLRASAEEITIDIIGATVARMVNTPSYQRDVFLTGTWLTWRPGSTKRTLHAFYFYDNPGMSGLPQVRQKRNTAGIHASGVYEAFDYELDGAYQFGDLTGLTPSVTIAAQLIGVRAGYTLKDFNDLRIGVGFDLLSGDDRSTTDKYESFHTLYATNHKFYGSMDYFLNIPSHTSDLGLQDIIVQISFVPVTGLKLGADAHIFSTAIDPLSVYPKPLPPTVNPDLSKKIGMELDLEASWKIADAVAMTFGFSVFDWDKNRALRSGRKTTNWSYLQTIVRF